MLIIHHDNLLASHQVTKQDEAISSTHGPPNKSLLPKLLASIQAFFIVYICSVVAEERRACGSEARQTGAGVNDAFQLPRSVRRAHKDDRLICCVDVRQTLRHLVGVSEQ